VTPAIRILHLEDSPRDAAMIQDRLELEGLRCAIVLVQGREDYEAALAREPFDLVLSDYNLPDYDGIAAVKKAREQQPDAPVIVISGSLNEEDAVRCIHLGATDYLFKARLNRLPSAVSRAIQDADERRRRREAETKWRESEERFRRLAEQSDQCFWFLALNPNRLLYVSPAVERIWGRPVEAFYQDPDLWFKTIHADDAPRIGQQWATAVDAGKPFILEFRVVLPDGSVRWVVDRGTLIVDSKGQVTMISGVVSDVTERKLLEEQFRQAQKMESVGQLAGGIAHDFNNLLTIINGMAELAVSQVVEGDQLYDDLQEIRRAGERAAALTSQLLAFSRKQILAPTAVNLNSIVAGIENMLQRLLGEDIALVVVPDDSLGIVKADPGQIEQVIANLAVNARDAMPHGGRLTIETRNVEIDETYARQHVPAVQPGSYVMLVVTDSGMGMDEATRARIFEPFFTTKDPGKGTGLGLSTVYGIVKQSDGFVWVYSEVGKGTAFKIYLPRVAETVGGNVAAPPATSSRGSETILLAEDVEGLRMLAVRILEAAGYTVLTAASGEDALAVLERHSEPVHLVITDVVMPGMSGRVLAEQFAMTHPGIKVLYMSGYTDDVIVRHGLISDGSAFLAKPFNAAQLTSKVRELLDATGRPAST
jgi:hypothetical protein